LVIRSSMMSFTSHTCPRAVCDMRFGRKVNPRVKSNRRPNWVRDAKRPCLRDTKRTRARWSWKLVGIAKQCCQNDVDLEAAVCYISPPCFPSSGHRRALVTAKRNEHGMSAERIEFTAANEQSCAQAFWPRWLSWVQALAALLAMVPCLRGRPACPWAWFVSCIVAVPYLLPRYRLLARTTWHSTWGALEAFPLDNARLPLRSAWRLVVLPAALIFLSYEHGDFISGDSRPVVLTACSLVSEGNCDLAEFVPAYDSAHLFAVPGCIPYFFRPTHSGIYSWYPIGMVPFALPAVVGARCLGADLMDPGLHSRLEKWTAAWLAAVSLGMFFLLAVRIVAPRPAWIATLLLAVGSIMFTTVSRALWQHGGVIFWTLLALHVEFGEGTRKPRLSLVVEGVSLAMMFACRLTSVAVILPLGLWSCWRSPGRACTLALVAGTAYAPWAIMHLWMYDNLFGASMSQTAGELWSIADLRTWTNVLISPSHGVLVYQPWLWLALYFIVPPLGRRVSNVSRSPCPAGWAIFCVSVVALQLIIVSCWNCWWGGFCWGSRLMSEAIPVAALLCLKPLAALWQTSSGRRLVAATLLVSALVHVPSVYLRQARSHALSLEPYAESWSAAPFLYPLRR